MKSHPVLAGLLGSAVGAPAGSLAMIQALNGNPWPAVLVGLSLVALVVFVHRAPRHRCVPPQPGTSGARFVVASAETGPVWRCHCGQRWTLRSLNWDGFHEDAKWMKIR